MSSFSSEPLLYIYILFSFFTTGRKKREMGNVATLIQIKNSPAKVHKYYDSRCQWTCCLTSSHTGICLAGMMLNVLEVL